MINKKFPELDKLISFMNKRHRYYANLIMGKYKDAFMIAPGGLYKHQSWQGGYADHVHEVMGIGFVLYSTLSKYRRLPFTLSEVLFVLFFHDIEKLFRFSVNDKGMPYKTRYAELKKYKSTLSVIKYLGIPLTQKERNAIKYIHGENEQYHPSRRVMNELAAFVHSCDTLSARLWYNYPLKK